MGRSDSALAQPFLDCQAIDVGHRHVQHQTGGFLLMRVGEKLARTAESLNLKPLGAEQSRQRLQHLGLVVEQIDHRFMAHDSAPSRGRYRCTMAPPAGTDSAQTRPPWLWTMERTMASPMPSPPGVVE